MIRWGILGAGKIAHRFAASLRRQPGSILAAISCRSAEKAAAFAALHSVGTAYIGHNALLADQNIDAIYLALPHGLHKEWAVKALEAGKAVLCEKPAALNAGETRSIAGAARSNGTLFMEAMKPRFVPLYPQVKACLASGVIGKVTAIETSYCNAMPFEKMGGTYHTQPGHGGALLDGGIYCASWLEDLLPGAPELVKVYTSVKDGIDHYTDAYLRFSGQSARLECAFDRARPRQAVLRGTNGSIVVEELHRPQTMTVCPDDQPPYTVTAAYEVDDFYGQIDHFVRCLEAGKTESDIMPLSASVRCARILDAVRAGLASTVGQGS